MSALTIKSAVSIQSVVSMLKECLYVGFLRILSLIPGNVAETFLAASLGLVFVAWQACALSMSGIFNTVEYILIAFQFMFVAVLFTKIIIWIRMHVNE